MSDYIIVNNLHNILILQGAAHARLGILRTLLALLTPEFAILRYSGFAEMVRQVWSVRNALQASSNGGCVSLPRGAKYVEALAYRVLYQSQ
jgi:hypothetical protein